MTEDSQHVISTPQAKEIVSEITSNKTFVYSPKKWSREMDDVIDNLVSLKVIRPSTPKEEPINSAFIFRSAK